MNCTEARSLIDYGIKPGSQTSITIQLGFHVSTCDSCRIYYDEHEESPNHPVLPNQLLTEIHHESSSPPSHESLHHPRKVMNVRQFPPIAGIVGILIIISGIVVWGTGIWLRTEQNLAAMIIPPIPRPVRQNTSHNPTGMLSAPALTATAMKQSVASPTAAVSPTPSHTPIPTPPALTKATTILLLGNDRRPNETSIPRTDSLTLVRFDPSRQRIAVLSLPRDLWVEIPGYGNSRINAAYVWGEHYGTPGGGFALARDTVSKLLGIPIDYVVMVDFVGFIGLIDTLGGVQVHVDKELYDGTFPTMDYGYTVAHFIPGLQLMDGVTALTYSRIRHPDSDFMRIRRQQAVLIGIANRLRERGDLQNLATADQITGALVGFVKTDIPRDQILSLLWAWRDYPSEYIQQYAVDASMVSFGVGNDLYAEVPLLPAFAELTRQFLGNP